MMTASKPTVLFLCTGNSCRSQMAEALLRHLAGDRFRVISAGLQPREIHPLALEVLRERGIDTAGLRSKSIAEFLGRASVAHAIVVCDMAQQNCPRIFPFALRENLYWPFSDPAALEGPAGQRLERFRAVRDQIELRLKQWIAQESAA